jgi:exonuclease SbcC
MRPLTLKITGLRSYRSEQTIDFSDAGLMAIVGDTGAGKSSILDAIFFALYGGCTWDRRAVTPLIADGATVMQVELVFVAEGRRWKVFRAASRTGTGGRHELTCLDDPAIRYDNSDPVTAAIRKLVGLDDEAFLRTVILPQGRFQALLQASRGDRTAILKGIFRLEQLAAVRDAADQGARRLRPGVIELRQERARLHDDPAGALEDAEIRQEQARAREATLKTVAEAVSAAQAKTTALQQHTIELQRLADLIKTDQRADAPQRLSALAQNAETINAQLLQLDGQRQTLRQHADVLEALLQEADVAGEGISSLASVATTLQSLITQLPGLAQELEACEDERRAIEELAGSVQEDEATIGDRERDAQAAKQHAESTLSAWRQATETLEEGRRRLGCARTSAQKAQAETAQAAQDEAALEPARVAVGAADSELARAISEQEQAQGELETVQRANAAAHAAEASHAGDPCPVCQRPLPADFLVPSTPGVTDVRSRLATAKTRLKMAQEHLQTTKTRLATLKETTRQAELRRASSITAAAGDLASLRELIPTALPHADDEVLLDGLSTAAGTAEAESKAAAAHEATLRQKLVAAISRLESAREEIKRRTTALTSRERTVIERKQSCERVARELPAAYHPTLPLDTTALATLANRVEERRSELAEVEQQLTSGNGEIRQLDEQHASLTRRRQDQVDNPIREIDRELVSLAQRLGDLVDHLSDGRTPERPVGTLAQYVVWAETLASDVVVALDSSDAKVLEFQAEAEELDGQVRATLTEHGSETPDELLDARIQTAAALSRAVDDANTARQQIPQVATLESAIGKAGSLLQVLDDLTKLLADGKFIGYVVEHKQQTLLSVASEILGSITGARYGFSDSFEIIDRLTGLPRGVKTLSGGETFMASLALALGLVELAGRGGGRLDALFLDEGFASLDANSLSEALDALGQQAEGGRLVVVISHLRAVAEAMEHLVAITRGPDGSRIQPLTGTVRDQLIEKEIEAGLLS